jgi:hypothetical protein
MKILNWRTASVGACGLVLACSAVVTTPAWAQGRRPSYSDQVQTGTTDANGIPNRQGGTITSNTGNTSTAATPLWTNPDPGPANRNPYQGLTYQPGTPGAGVSDGSAGINSGLPAANRSTLGTAAPAQINTPTPGLQGTQGSLETTRNGISGSPPGNPGPVGSMQAPNPAQMSQGVGANGSGASGIPGAITNSGTHGSEGSGH